MTACTLNPLPGDRIQDVIADAVHVSRTINGAVDFTFNDRHFIVYPWNDEEEIWNLYQNGSIQ